MHCLINVEIDEEIRVDILTVANETFEINNSYKQRITLLQTISHLGTPYSASVVQLVADKLFRWDHQWWMVVRRQ